MSSDPDEIIDAEIVGSDNLPAVIERPVSYQTDEPIKGQERDWDAYAEPSRRCVGHKKTGERCKNAAILGSTVCRFHGGAARHVKAAARARLDNAADLMAKHLLGIAIGGVSEAVRLQAIRDALDRAGVSKPTEVVLSPGQPKQPWEEVFEGISEVSREESRRARGVSDADDVFAGLEGAHSQVSSQTGPEGQSSNPPPKPEPGHTSRAADPQHRRNLSNSTDDTSDDDYLGDSASGQHEAPYPSESQVHRPGPGSSDRDGQPQRRQRTRSQARHVTGDEAIRIANETNRSIGALPPLRELESPHKRYRRP